MPTMKPTGPQIQRAVARELRKAEAASVPAPPSVLSEALIKDRCADYGESPEDPVLRLGREARGRAAKSASEIQKSAHAILKNPMKPGALRLVDAYDLVRQSGDTQSAEIESIKGRIETRISEMEKEIAQLLQPPTDAFRALAPEIRSYLRGLSEDRRDDLLSQTGSDDYHALMYAVASAPAWMSGVAQGQKIGIVNTILGLRRPQLLSLPSQYRAELARLEKCVTGYGECLREMVDHEGAEAIKALAGGGV